MQDVGMVQIEFQLQIHFKISQRKLVLQDVMIVV